MTARIALTQGLHTLVDDCDADWVRQWDWRACRRSRHLVYAFRGDGHSAPVLLHREIARRTGLDPTGLHVDHVNGDGLDNRRENLRVATSGQNQHNQRHKSPGKSSRYKGVTWNAQVRKWQARICRAGHHHYLGLFTSEAAAQAAYAAAAVELFGEYAAPYVEEEPLPERHPTPSSTPRKTRSLRSSRYLGVAWNRACGKWEACVKVGGRKEYVGLYSHEADAALARDIVHARHHGLGAVFNVISVP